jgi:hypothetical protein
LGSDLNRPIKFLATTLSIITNTAETFLTIATDVPSLRNAITTKNINMLHHIYIKIDVLENENIRYHFGFDLSFFEDSSLETMVV